MNYIALIPARKNSKRIKNKNLLKINNKDLIDIAIIAALKVKEINKIIISSDHPVILKKKKKYKVKKISFIKREKKLSGDKNTIEELIMNLNKKKILKMFRNIIILQPTSPLRKSFHIRECIKEYERKSLDSIFSVYADKVYLWNEKFESMTYNYKNRENSQDMKKYYFENGAIFIFNLKKFFKLKNKRRIFGKFNYYKMEKNLSIDINIIDDLKFCK